MTVSKFDKNMRFSFEIIEKRYFFSREYRFSIQNR
jgi:hypothetical protein